MDMENLNEIKNTYYVSSVEEFDLIINSLKKYYTENYPRSILIFRGQSNVDWNIVSSAYRYMHNSFPTINITNVVLEYFIECVQGDMEELREYCNGMINLDNDDQVMCMLQHLGGKSIFIDFSKNSHVALYFACEKYQSQQDGIVFVMRNQDNSIFNTKEKIGVYKQIDLDEKNPIYSRVRIQNSCFLRPYNDGIICNDDNIIKIVIDKNCKSTILKDISSDINHKVVYPDIFGYIGRQRINTHTDTLKSIVFRETAQLITDGNVRRMEYALTALNNLEHLDGLESNDYLRIKCLKIKSLMCAKMFDEALKILSSIQDTYLTFHKMNDINALTSNQFDPMEEYFIKDFEVAKCYMGKCEYEIAHDYYTAARTVLDKIVINDETLKFLRNEILKQHAISLVRQNKNNLSLSLEILSELGKENDLAPDIAGIYIILGEWNKAIELLRNRNDDYSLNLRANCYMELSKVGNKKLYLNKAIEIYKKALIALNDPKFSNSHAKYRPKTYDHDHHFKLAMAYEELKMYEEAKKEYEIIIKYPYENEDAMHDLAYLLYKMNKSDYEKIIQQYFYAIHHSRIKKHPRNYNDIGSLLLEMYTLRKQINLNETLKIIKANVDKISNDEIYPENIQFELNIIAEHILNGKDEVNLETLLLVAERLFCVADLLNRKDAFANKNIGDIYYIKYSQNLDSERNRYDYAKKSLKRYILAHSYYSIDNIQSILR